MKKTTIFKVLGFCFLAVGAYLIFIASTKYRDKSFDERIWAPHFGLLSSGSFIAFFSIGLLLTGFNPELTKLGAQLKSETIDHAGEDIKSTVAKTADTIIPAITPSIKEAVSEINDFNDDSKEKQLLEAKKLLDSQLITEEEYKQMRKKILGI